MDHHGAPGAASTDSSLVVAGNAGLVSSDNFQATLLDVEEYRRFLATTNAPTNTFALVRRRVPSAPTGWAWDLYAKPGNSSHDWQVRAGHQVPRSSPLAPAAGPSARTPEDSYRLEPAPAPSSTSRCAGVSAGRSGQAQSDALASLISRDPLAWQRARAISQDAASASRCQDRFARWAEQYEQDVLSRLLTKLHFRAAARLRLTATDRFLDVGCATGAAVRDASVTVSLAVGIDRSAAMVRRARVLARALPGAVFVMADADQLPFPAATFSAVLSASTLRHISNPTRAVCEMARVVRPGGRIVVADFVACGDHDDRHWWNSVRPPRQVPRWIGPLQVVSAGPVLVTEVVRCSTAFGYYAIVSAAKPKATCW
jgi:SAM-dependent methyltransferase